MCTTVTFTAQKFKNVLSFMGLMLLWLGGAHAAEVVKSYSVNPVDSGNTSTLTIGFTNTSGATLTGAQLTDTLPITTNGRMIVATPPNVRSNTCGGTITAVAGAGAISIAGASLPVSPSPGVVGCSFLVDVVGKSSIDDSLPNVINPGQLTFSPANTAQDNKNQISQSLSVSAFASPSASLSLSKTTILVGEQTILTIAVTNTSPKGSLTNAAWSMTLPANLTVAATPSVVSGCGSGTFTAGTTVGGSTIGFQGGTVAVNSGVCTLSVPIVSNLIGTYSNISLPANAITDDQLATKITASPAPTLAVQSISGSERFTSTAGSTISTIQANVPFRIEVTVTNTGNVSYSGLSITDNFTADGNALGNLKLTNTSSPVFTATGCGSPTVAQVGANAGFKVTGATIAAATFPATTTCVISVEVYSAGTFTSTANNIPVANITTTSPAVVTPFAPLTANIAATTFILASNANVSKSYSPTTIAAGATSTVTITINNTSVANFTALTVSDTLPTNVTVNTVTGNTCSGLTSPAANAASFALTGGTLAAGTSCAVTFTVNAPNFTGANVVYAANTATIGFTHYAATESLTATTPTTLTVTPLPVTLSKTFTPAGTVAVGTVPSLDIAMTNSSSAALSSLTIVDALSTYYTGATIAAVSSNTCNTTTNNPVAGQNTINASGGSLAAGATCHLIVTLNLPNTTAAARTMSNSVTSTFNYYTGQATPTSLTAIQSITVSPLTVSPTQGFSPTTVNTGSTSVLTFTIINPSSLVALTNVQLSDTLPAGMTVASYGSSTNCGTVGGQPAANAASIALTGMSIAAGATCTVSVNVYGVNTGATSAALSNTGATISVTQSGQATAQTFNIPAQSLTVNVLPAVTTTKSFVSPITAGQTSTMTISLTNPAGAATLINVVLSDTLTNMSVAAFGSSSAGCGSLTGAPIAGATSINMTGGSIAAGATCTVTMTMTPVNTGATAATRSNTATFTFDNYTGQTSHYTASATGSVIVNPFLVTVTKTFAAYTLNAGETTGMSIAIQNPSTTAALSTIVITDALPAGMTVLSYVSDTGCGTVGNKPAANAVSFGTGITVASIGINTLCTINLTVSPANTTATAKTFNNTANVSASYNGQTYSYSDAAPTLTVNPLSVPMTKSFGTTTVTAGQTTTMSITINNPSASTYSAVSISDALPAGLTVVSYNGQTNCGSPTNTAGAITTTGITIAAGATCTLNFTMSGANTTAAAITYSNTATVASLSYLATTYTNIATATTPTLLTVNPFAVAVTKAFTPATIEAGQTATMTIVIPNTSAAAFTAVGVTDTLPGGMKVVSFSTPVSADCGTFAGTPSVGATTLAMTGGTVPAGHTCTINITVSAPNTGVTNVTFNNTAIIPLTYSGQNYSYPAVAPVFTVTPFPYTLTKAFVSNPAFPDKNVAVNGNVQMTFTIQNNSATQTMTSIVLADPNTGTTMVGGLKYQSVDSNNCGFTGFPAVNATSLSLTGGSLAPGASCQLTVTVKATTSGSATNTAKVTFTAGQQTGITTTAADTLLVSSLTATKAFAGGANPQIAIGGTDTISITIYNWDTAAARTSVAFTDTLTSKQLMVAAAGANSTNSCGGTFAPVASATTVTLSGGGIPAATSSGGVVTPGSCTLTFDVDATGTTGACYSNTIHVTGDTSTQTVQDPTVPYCVVALAGGYITYNPKTFSPTSVIPDAISKVALDWKYSQNTTGPTRANVTVTDLLPVGLTVAATPNFGVSCQGTAIPTGGASNPHLLAVPTISTVSGRSQISFTVIGQSSGGSKNCVATFDVTANTVGSYYNFMDNTDVTAVANSGTNPIITNAINTANATLLVTSNIGFTPITKSYSRTPILVGDTAVVTINVTNGTPTGTATISNVDVTDSLPLNLMVAATPNASYNCGTSTPVTPTILHSPEKITIRIPSIARGASCSVSFSVTSNTVGTYDNTILVGDVRSATTPAYQNTTASTTVSLVVQNSIDFAVSKSFSRTPIVVGDTARVSLQVTNNAPTGTTSSVANIDVTDPLPIGLALAATPNASYSCTNPVNAGGALTPTVIGQNVTLRIPSMSTAQICTVSFDVVGNTAGSYSNSIAAGGVAAAGNPTNYKNPLASNAAPLVVQSNIDFNTLTKTFLPATILSGGLSTVTVSWKNNAPTGSAAVTNIDVTDNLPANIRVASNPNASYSCTAVTGTYPVPALPLTSVPSPTVTIPRDSITIQVPTQGTQQTCSVSFDVTSSVIGGGAGQAAWGNYIGVGGIAAAGNATNYRNPAVSTTVYLTVVGTVNFASVTKSAFVPATVGPSMPSVVSVNWTNNATGGTPAVTNVQLEDVLPTGMRLATVPNASYSCAAVTGTYPVPAVTSTPLTPTVVGQSVKFLIPSQGAQQICTVTFSATADVAGTYGNKIIIGGITSLDSAGYSNTAASGTSNLIVDATLGFNTVSKSFSLTSIPVNGISTVTISFKNNTTLTGTPNATNVDVIDGLPAGITVAATPNATYNCGTLTSVTPTVSTGRDVITIRVPSVPKNTTCTVKFDVTSTVGGTWYNQIPIGNIVSADFPLFKNTVASGSMPLTAVGDIGVTKSFSETNLGSGAVVRLTIQLTNPESVNLNGVSFTDTLPSTSGAVPRLLVAPTPNASTNCGSGTVTAVAGAATVALSGGVIPRRFSGVDGNCTVSVDVIADFGANTSGSLVNIIAVNAVTSTDTPARKNSLQATASVTITAPRVTVSKQFLPNSVAGRAASRLEVTIRNPQTYAQTGVVFDDDMTNAGTGGLAPNNLLISSTPNVSSTCGTSSNWSFSKIGGGALTGGESGFHFSGGIVAAAVGAVDGSCTVSIEVIPQLEGSYINTIPANAVTTANGAKNTVSVQGSFISSAGISVTKMFSPNPTLVGVVQRLTITLGNSSLLTDYTSAAVTDVLPTGMKIVNVGNETNSCVGSLTLDTASNPNRVILSGGTIPHNNTCSIGVDVLPDTGCSYPNTIGIHALSARDPSNNIFYNEQAGSNTSVVNGSLKVVKVFSPTSDSGAFTFTVSPNVAVGSSTLAVDKNTNFSAVAPFAVLGGTTYTITETGNNPTLLTDYNTVYSCADANGTILASGLGASFTVAPPASCGSATVNQQTITCTVLNINKVTGANYDYGDAPASYGSASHFVGISPSVYLGSTRPEAEFTSDLSTWQAQTTATGDDTTGTADEGISQLLSSGNSSFPVLSTAQSSYSLTLRCAGTTAANAVSGWIDFNRNNTFDAGERAQGTCSSAAGGTATLTWNTFTGINAGATFARFRIASNASESASVASVAADGEAEDYRLTIASGATVTVTKVSNGGVGTFTFTGTNGWVSQDITTVTAGVGVVGVTQTLTAVGVSTDIIESTPPAGFSLVSISCTGLGAGGTATTDLLNRKVTLDAAATAMGSTIACTFTNTATAGTTLTLRKQWLGAVVNDEVNITATGLTPLVSVANTVSEIDTGAAQGVVSGAVITIGETYTVGSASHYTSFLACTGTTGLSGNVLTVGASDTAIVCTETNSYSHGITGRVFKDNGAGGGIANNGLQEGGEVGIAGVTITAASGATVYGTAVTDGNGDYAILLPASMTGAITLTETNLSGMLSTGGSVGNSAGTYTRSSDVIAFNVVAGTTYTGLNFGDVPDNQFTTDGAQAATPGSVVFYPHRFVAGTAGSVTFALTNLASPSIAGWSELVYEDTNCSASIDGGDTLINASRVVTADQIICLLVKEFVPSNVPVNAQNAVTVTANFAATFSGTAVSYSYVRHDTTTVGQASAAGLTLVKAVSTATALPGANITYTVTYTNNSTGPLSNVVINDATPAYTTFVSAACGALPLNFTACNIAVPAVGGIGSIIYTFTGTLAPAGTGAVNFTVQVQP